MKFRFKRVLLFIGILGACLVGFQNCGVVTLSRPDAVQVDNKACNEFLDSRPEAIYEDASLNSDEAVFKMNEVNSSGQLVSSQRLFDWAIDGDFQQRARDLKVVLDSLEECRSYEITASLNSCDKTYVWKKSYLKAGATCQTTTTLRTPSNDARGCTDDNTVPLAREIDFATEPGESVGPNGVNDLNWKYVFDRPMRNRNISEHQAFCDSNPEQPYPSQWPSYYAPPSCYQVPNVIAVKLKVVSGGGNWYSGVLQIGPTRGTSTADAVISRCRGRFDGGGRVHVIHLDGEMAPGDQSASTFFPAWVVDAKNPLDVYTANLISPGKVASDGWVSDGVYYINVRQTWCNGGIENGGVCWRSFHGSGVSREQLGRDR